MKRTSIHSISLAGVLLTASLSVVHADTWDKKTIVNFSEPIEVPGAILQPGKYVMKIVDSQSDRHVIQFTNERQNHVYASTIAVPVYRAQVTGRTVITFYEAAVGQPEPIRNWYYPGDNFGQEFVYPKGQLQGVAFAQPMSPAPDTKGELQTPITAAEPVREGESALGAPSETQAQASNLTNDDSKAPVEIAQATPPRQPEAPAVTPAAPPAQPAELPKTNGNLAGIALIGLVSVGAAVTARKLRRF